MEDTVCVHACDDYVERPPAAASWRDVSGSSHTTQSAKWRSGFIGDVLRLAGGTTLAQLFVIAAAPILTRVYSPASFGTAAQFAAITGVIVVVACLRYELSIVLPKSDEDGAVQLWVSLFFATLITVITLVVFLLLPSEILTRLGAEHVRAYAALAAFMVGSGGALNALNYWNSRTRKYGRLAAARVANNVVTAGSQIGLAGPAGGSAAGLVSGYLIGNGVAAGGLALRVIQEDRRVLARALHPGRMLRGVQMHWQFPAFNALGAVMNALSWQLPALVLGFYFGADVVGYYALGFRVLALPMSLVGLALGQVFYQRAASARRTGDLDGLVRSVYSALVNLGVAPFVILALAGEDVFAFAFGQQWAEAGVYVQILSIWTLVWFISSPLSTLYAVLDRQGASLWFNAAILATRFASLAIGGMLADARLAMALFAISGVGVYGYLNWFIMTRSGVRWLDTWTILGRALVRGLLPCGLVAVFVVAGAASWGVFCVSACAVAANTVWAARRWRDILGPLGRGKNGGDSEEQPLMHQAGPG